MRRRLAAPCRAVLALGFAPRRPAAPGWRSTEVAGAAGRDVPADATGRATARAAVRGMMGDPNSAASAAAVVVVAAGAEAAQSTERQVEKE